MMAIAGFEAETVAISLLLIGAFIIAYRVLKMLLETAFVSFISSVFYVAMAVLLDYPLNIDRILSFAFMGATLYMAYSMAASTFKGVSKLFSVIGSIFKPVVNALVPNRSKQEKRIRKLEKDLKNYGEKLKKKAEKPGKDKENEEPGTVKEVVLNNKEKED